MVVIILLLFLLVLGFKEIRKRPSENERLKNVKLLKDIHLNLYQIRDVVNLKSLNGDKSTIENELRELNKVITFRIPDYIDEISSATSVIYDTHNVESKIDNMINSIDEIMTSYNNELENLDYILADYSKELRETVNYLDRLYIKMK